MKRYMAFGLSLLFVLSLCGAAAAYVDQQGQGAISVELTVDSYTQIWFQDDAWATPPATGDLDIEFSSTKGVDYYRATASGLIGQYLVDANQGAAEGWANGYFESQDGATIWMKSNVDFTGSVATGGDLANGTATIPTWFTIAVNGYDEVNSVSDPNGFRLGNASGGWVNDGTIPGDGKGGYAGDGDTTGEDVSAAVTFSFGGQAFWPSQDAFQMSVTSGWAFDLDAPVGPGTMKFLARCLRSGVADVAGAYSTTLSPTFTVPSP